MAAVVSASRRTSLALLLGAARARVLGSLGQPRTTGDVADALGIAPSTASEHLTALVRAGVAARERTGRVVEYRLTDAGAALLDLFPLDPVLPRAADRSTRYRR